MYPRLKRVRRGDQVHEYVQLVEGRREAGKVRQRVVATLGRLDELKASGQLDRWAGAFTRLDPPAAGVHREVGPLLVVAHYLRRLGLDGIAAALEALRRLCPPGLVTVIDSAAGNLKTLAAIDRQKLRFVVPLRADNGWAARFDVDLPGGIDALPELDHVAQREQHLPSQLRTRYRGQLVDYPAVDPKTKSRHAFRVAYTWSSEEARSVADARERALAKAEAALAKVRNGL